MTTALLVNALLGFTLFAVILTLLAGAIRLGYIDGRHAIARRRRQLREHQRPVGVARHQTHWTVRPNAS